MFRRGDGWNREGGPPQSVYGERAGRNIGYGGVRGRVGGGGHSRGGRYGRDGAMPPQFQQERSTPSSSSSASCSSSLSKAFEEGVQIHDNLSELAVDQFSAPTMPSSVDFPIPLAEKPPEAAVSLVSGYSTVPAARTYFGSLGTKVLIRANHFLVEVEDKNIFQYAVKMEPEVKSKAFGRTVMKKLIDDFGELHCVQHKLAYDGRSIFYTAGQLPFTSKDFELTVIERSRNRTYRVSIEFTKGLDLLPLKQFLKGTQRESPQDIIQALDVVLREFPSEKYVSVSRSFFSPIFGNREAISGGLECWRGYYQSLRPTQMGLSLNLDISATSFYKPIKLIEFLLESLELRTLPKVFSENLRMKANKVLKGIRVETTHNSDSTRRYKITGLTSQPATELMFSVAAQEDLTISVVQYFKERYNYNLIYASFPCVQSGSSNKPAYLPMEVCKIVEGQKYSKKLNEKQVTNILRTTCKRPADREKSILNMCKQNDYTNDTCAKEFGITINPRITSIQARILTPPKIKYHDGGKEQTCNPSLGKWNMIGKRMFKGATVNSWACICFAELVTENAISSFCDELVSMCNNIGMVFSRDSVFINSFYPPSQIENGLRDLHHSFVEKSNRQEINHKHLQMLIVVLPDASGSYGRIKTICETELGIMTQCCRPTKVMKHNKQYLENIALKINVKVGGSNSVLEDAFYSRLPLISAKPTIIFGADVTHPSPGDDSQSSIAAVVASIDWPCITTYRSRVSSQQHLQEIIQDLFFVTADNAPGGMIRELMIEFYKATNNKRPERIIFYRDGVSEGQFSQVSLYEINAIKKACASLQDGYNPPITFVVVQKRHHTRLFSAQQDLTDRSGNILPGTVVDRTICHPTEFDFYLCSHSGIQGTSRPTHYHVLLDENKFSVDALQTLTYNLCYTYARCTRSVSVVPPVYYAHLAAFRARYYLEGMRENGSDRVSEGTNMREITPEIQSLPNISENIKNAMFFC